MLGKQRQERSTIEMQEWKWKPNNRIKPREKLYKSLFIIRDLQCDSEFPDNESQDGNMISDTNQMVVESPGLGEVQSTTQVSSISLGAHFLRVYDPTGLPLFLTTWLPDGRHIFPLTSTHTK